MGIFKKKLVLIQLPVLTQDIDYYLEFVPLGIGSISSYVKKYLPQWEVFIPPLGVLVFGNDDFLLQNIISYDPDIVGFSCFLWNVQRNIFIAKKLKQIKSNLLIVFGGPEVTPDNEFLLNTFCFDIGVVGEGEFTFLHLLNALEGSQKLENIPNLILKKDKYYYTGFSYIEKPINLSPYIDGCASFSFAKTALFETVRGCPNKCGYCFYHRNLKKIVPFSTKRLIKELEYARKAGVKEISFVDPSLLSRPDINDLFRLLQDVNKDESLTFFGELNAEHCSHILADNLRKCGFKTVEVGLQSINKKTLQLVNRRFDKKRFITGIRALKDSGIEVILDIIVGLPGDTLEDVKKSIDFVMENDLFTYLNLYPLHLLPGTRLRELAKHLRLTYDKAPPYLVESSTYMELEDIFFAYEYVEEITGIDFFPPSIPVSVDNFYIDHGLICYFKIKDLNDFLKDISKLSFCNFVVFEINDPYWMQKKDCIRKICCAIIEKNPYVLINWIVPVDLTEGIDKGDILVFFPQRQLFLDKEYFSTSPFLNSTQLFLKLDLDSNFSLIKVPYDTFKVLNLTRIIEKQNHVWILLSRYDDRLEEESIKKLEECALFDNPICFRVKELRKY